MFNFGLLAEHETKKWKQESGEKKYKVQYEEWLHASPSLGSKVIYTASGTSGNVR
jgi:hypothetical protein